MHIDILFGKMFEIVLKCEISLSTNTMIQKEICQSFLAILTIFFYLMCFGLIYVYILYILNIIISFSFLRIVLMIESKFYKPSDCSWACDLASRPCI